MKKDAAISDDDTKVARAPAVTVVEFTDPTAAADHLEVLDQDVVQLQSKPLLAKRVSVRLSRSMIVYQSTNRRVRTRTNLSPDSMAFVVFGPQSEGTFNGLALRTGLLLAAAPGVSGDFVVGAGYESVAVLLSPALLQEHQKIRRPRDAPRDHHGTELLQVRPSLAQSLFDWGKGVSDAATQDPEMFDDHEVARAAAQLELLDVLLAALDSASPLEPTRSERTMQAHSKVVRVAEAHAATHTLERVSVTDLCKGD